MNRSFWGFVRQPQTRLAYLVDIDGPGVRLRYAESTYTVDGTVYKGAVTVETPPGVELDVWRARPSYQAATVKVAATEALHLLEDSQKVSLRRCSVSVRLWVVGQAKSVARIYSYRMESWTATDAGEVTLSLRPLWDRWDVNIPDKAITSDDWDDLDTGSENYSYPILYGAFKSQRCPTVELAAKRSLIAGHYISALTEVRVDGSVDGGATLLNTTDVDGDKVALVDLVTDPAGLGVFADGTGFSDTSRAWLMGRYFGTYGLDNPGAILGHLLGYHGELDSMMHLGSVGRMRAALASWSCCLSISAEVRLLEVASRLAQWAGWCFLSEDGQIVFREINLTTNASVMDLVRGRDIMEADLDSGEATELGNTIKVHFDFSQEEGQYLQSVQALASKGTAQQRDAVRRYGARTKRFQCPETHDKPTAIKIANRLLALRYKVRREMTVTVTHKALALNPLDVVRITHDGFGFTRKPFMVTGITADLAEPTLNLLEV